MKRTTTLDILRFAWTLWRSGHRPVKSIPQIMQEAVYHNSRYGTDLTQLRNADMNKLIREFWY